MRLQSQDSSIYTLTIRLLFLLLIVVWCGFIIYPFLNIMLWSIILAMALFPLHKMISDKLGTKPKLASAIIILVLAIIFILPAIFLTLKLIDEVKVLKASFIAGTLTIPLPNEKVKEWPVVGENMYSIWTDASHDLAETVSTYKEQLISIGKNLVRGILSATGDMIQIFVAFIIAGIVLAIEGVGESIRKLFRKLAGDRGDEFADVSLLTVGSVVKGVIGVALIQAFLHGLLFVFSGIPFAGLLTIMIFVLSLVQVPVLLITLPVIIYLFGEESATMATIWTVLFVVAALSDNVLKPVLLGKGAPVPMLVIFIGVIGGFLFSGFIGLFTGAILMTIGYKLLVSWINSEVTDEVENTII